MKFAIADSGATSTRWAIIDGKGCVDYMTTPGINAIVDQPETIRAKLADVGALFNGDILRIDFYGAGCLPGPVSDRMIDALYSATGCPDIRVGSDMLCAAVALCGNEPGIACILGTGSNSCLYNGREIVDNVSPLGFILGDEGSGAAIGKALISDYLKRQLSDPLSREIAGRFPELSPAYVVGKVYRSESPSRWLASFVPFVAETIGRFPELRTIVRAQFEAFLRRNVAAYEDAASLPVNFTGSVSKVFESELREACDRAGFKVGRITADPLPLLVAVESEKFIGQNPSAE